MASAVRPSGLPIAQINITPLVDVMLVPLIIFTLSVPLLTRTLQTHLPQAGGATPTEPVVLEVSTAGYRLDGRTLAAGELDAALRARAQRSPATALTLRASDDVDYQAVATALAAAQRSGVRHLGQAF